MNERGCYCGLPTDEREDLPDGYCGRCERCGRPGHTRHFPGAVPYTGEWCDRHYRAVAFLHPFGMPSSFLWLIGGLAVALLIFRTCMH